MFKKDRENDRDLIRHLHKIYDEADIIIAHNGDRFDHRKAAARFIYHGLPPPARFQSIDTLKIARKHFKFDSNKLDDLAAYLRVGIRKLPHTGKHLWLACMAGDKKAVKTMRRYNSRDVEILERVFNKFRGWHSTHPNLNLYTGGHGCPTCQSPNIRKRGMFYGKTVVRQRLECSSCGAQFSGEIIKTQATLAQTSKRGRY